MILLVAVIVLILVNLGILALLVSRKMDMPPELKITLIGVGGMTLFLIVATIVVAMIR